MAPDRVLSLVATWCRLVIQASAPLVPSAWRHDWRAEWLAECAWRLRRAGSLGRGTNRAAMTVAWRVLGAVVHAVWWRWTHMRGDIMRQDLRDAWRSLGRQPLLTAAAVLTLALGIGANTAIFSIVDAILFRPLPYAEPERLVHLWETNPSRGWVDNTVAPANLIDWRARSRTLEAFAYYMGSDTRAAGDQRVALEGGNAAEFERVRALFVSPGFFDTLGVRPFMGRTFLPQEGATDGVPVAVITHGLWRRMGAPSDVLGRDVRVNGTSRVVVGVLPRGFTLPASEADLFYPAAPPSWANVRKAHFLRAIARLRAGVTLEEARADMTAIAADLEREYPATNQQMGVGVGPLDEWFVGEARRPLLLLLGGVSLVWLMACANVASLLLTRASGRTHELATRAALGASRWRLVRLLAAESLVLAAAGGVLASALAAGLVRLFIAVAPADVPRLGEIAVDSTIFGVAAGLSLVAAAIFGIAPVLRLSRVGPRQALVAGGRGGDRASGSRVRRILVAVQLSASVPLVTAAVLVAVSLFRLNGVHPGFDPDGLLTFRISLPGATYDSPQKRAAFFDRLTAALEDLQGVKAAGAASRVALEGFRWTGDLSIEARPGFWGRELRHKEVTEGYFEALGLAMRRGQGFAPHPEAAIGEDSRREVVVNEAFARAFFGTDDVVGQRISYSRPTEPPAWRTIVGVVGDEKQDGLGSPVHPEVYDLHYRQPQSEMTVVARVAGDPGGLVADARTLVRRLDPALPLHEVRTMRDILDASLARERFASWATAGFALLALVLAIVGVYGVAAYSVSTRTREFGIRMALGAHPREVVATLVREAGWQTGLGLAAGAVGALLVGQVLQGLLFETRATDPAVLTAVVGLLAVVALVATYLPARRALSIDPVMALRDE